MSNEPVLVGNALVAIVAVVCYVLKVDVALQALIDGSLFAIVSAVVRQSVTGPKTGF